MRSWKSRITIPAMGVVLAAAIAAGVGMIGQTPAAHAAAAEPAAPAEAAAPAHGVLDEFSHAFRNAADRVDPSVVTITSEQKVQPISAPGEDLLRRFFGNGATPQPFTEHGLGSGVIVRPDGYILTNNHVVADATQLNVEIGNRTYPAEVVGTDPETDLAVIHIDAAGLPAAELGDSDELHVGDWVIAVGNPMNLRHSVTAGIVSATGRDGVGITDYENFIQTDASINPGNSGGALADLDGRVVGINTAIASPSGGNVGIGFAIPIDMARKVMNQLISDGAVTRGYLALLPQDLDPDLAKALNLEGVHGALVGDVTPDGPAARAGLRRGDVIVSFDGKPIADAAELRNRVADVAPGKNVPVGILRDGETRTVHVKLAERPSEAVASAGPGQGSGNDTGRLGITVEPLTPDIARQLGLDPGTAGVVVAGVEPGGPAAEAGLRPGDRIEAVGRDEVSSVQDLRNALKAHGEGTVALLVEREGRTFYVAVEKA